MMTCSPVDTWCHWLHGSRIDRGVDRLAGLLTTAPMTDMYFPCPFESLPAIAMDKGVGPCVISVPASLQPALRVINPSAPYS